MEIGLIGLGVLVVLILWFILTYNSLVAKRNQVKNAWSQIDVQLKRRHDLIPNLIETVRGYMKHERETLENIARARSGAMSAQGVANIAQAESQLTSCLRGFYAVAENYPDLKANQNFIALQQELAATENKISFSRQFYNDAAMLLNNAIESIPSNIVAGLGGFKKADFFEITVPEERNVPKVQF